jgi:hypothetical protein
MIKIWKGKSSDLLLVLLYFVLYTIGIHIIAAIRHSIKYDESIVESIKNPVNFLFTFGLLFFFMSPVWVYFRKVPKMLKIDLQNKMLVIHKKRKILQYNMDKIRFYKRVTSLFYILEIHATFESSRNEQFERLATSIIVPNWGLSWNKTKMEEIVTEFKDMNIEEIKNRPQLPIYEYFYN